MRTLTFCVPRATHRPRARPSDPTELELHPRRRKRIINHGKPLEAQRIGAVVGDQRFRQSINLPVSNTVTARAS